MTKIKQHIHIISFNIPYPPDYGGVIDVFYKLKALNEKGFKINLHCFGYGRELSPELKNYCENLYYYTRHTGLHSQANYLPYIVYSRRSPELLKNLLKDKHPILFEGLHSCYFLNHKLLRDRIKIVRAHNIEHLYYYKLYTAEANPFNKLFFLSESLKLYMFEKRLKHADLIAAISEKELKYFSGKYKNAFLLRAFHSSDNITIKQGKGDYILYHGNLSVPENLKAVNYLVDKVFNRIDHRVIIAGKNPSGKLRRKLEACSNIQLISTPGKDEMKDLIRNAHINILLSFQETGIKLKLLESLFNGRFCIANSKISGDSELADLCERANSPTEILIKIKKLIDTEFSENDIALRKKVLDPYRYSSSATDLEEKLELF